MKTAISIPDDLFRQADQLAAESGQSRSQLYSRAVREYIIRHTSDKITAALDSVYGEPENDQELESVEIASRETFGRSEW